MKFTDDRHSPVMVEELLKTLDLKQSNTVIDATYGFGGHAQHVLDSLGPNGQLIGIERDPDVFRQAQERVDDSRVTLINDSYQRLQSICDSRELVPEAVYFDFGVSSYHFDDSPRGFSYRRPDDPFDCRLNPEGERPKASEILNDCSIEELETILADFGEVRSFKRVRDALLEARPVSTVGDVTRALEEVLPPHKVNGELARVFQAFRIFVNDELEHLEEGVEAAVEVLSEGGRLAGISYHSLEDRILKQVLRYEAKECVCPPDLPVCACEKIKRLQVASNSPLSPSDQEVDNNPRARSATLRSAIKIQSI